MKSSLQKKYTAPGSPTVHKFHATATPDTEVRKRVEAVAKLDNIRQQWENGTVRQASNKTEAKKNFEAHIDKIRTSRVNSSVRQNAAEEEVGGDIEMPNNPDAPELDITNLSAEDCDLLMENIKLYKETGYQKVDNESLKDRWFQKTLLKMMSKPKSAAERSKSAPRGASSKAEGTSTKRSQSVRIARPSGRGADSDPREPDKIEEQTTGVETDGDDSHAKWTEVTYGQKKRTDTKRYTDESSKTQNDTNYQSNDYDEDAGWKGKLDQEEWTWAQKGQSSSKDSYKHNHNLNHNQRQTADGWHQQSWNGWIDYGNRSSNSRGAQDQQWQSPQQLQSNDDSSKGKGKGNSKRRQPKDDDTKKREINFSNFPQMAAHKHMEFMIKMVEDFGLIEDIEKEHDKDGKWLPIMYAFGQVTARSCAIRFKTQDLAKESLRDMRQNGTIEYHGGGEVRKVRVNSGYDNRSLEQKTAEFQMRKLRSSIMYHEVPSQTWHTEWKQQKLWQMPDGKWEDRIEIARWNPKTWKMEFLKEMMASSKLWRSIRYHWNLMIESKTPDNDFAYESEGNPKKSENENDWSGTDGNWNANEGHSGGDEEWRGHTH